MYDAIIIGAGISGLVCGCYLAKAGMKVLIAEQHYKPGGYCTSFKRQGFTFDAAVHSLGGYKHGILGKIFNELGVDKKIEFLQFDPSDSVITSDYKVSFWRKLDKTIKEFQIIFPKESDNIRNFFYYFINFNPQSLVRMRNWTFKDLLDRYFNNHRLKATLALPLFGNTGLPPSQISAFLGIGIFKECVLDGGYYPKGGMQVLSDTLVKLLEEYGGEINLSCRIKRIKTKENKVTGIISGENDIVLSKYVISNCDARQTFYKLLGRPIVDQDFLNKINNMIPSLSMFVLYLGLDKYFDKLPEAGTSVWVLSHYDLDNVYFSAKEGKFNKIGVYLLHVSADKKSVVASMFAPFKNKQYWEDNKMRWLESFIKRLKLEVIPKLSEHILYREAATPYTLYRYTLNYKGAAYGWAGIPSQLALSELKKPSFIQGLYLTGHWTTYGVGIPGVTYVGYDTAKSILRKEKLY